MKTHGGDIYQAASGLGVSPSEITDFSASLNPLGMPKGVVKWLRRMDLDSLIPYPEPRAEGLVGEIAGHHRLDPKLVIPGNGSTELIYLIPRALSPRRVLVTAPTFSEYERASMAAGARTKRLLLMRDADYALDTDKFASNMRSMDMAFLCNPANPTGQLLDKGAVKTIIRAAARERCMLVVDEAFMDFTPEQSVLGLRSPWLIVLRSMTKFYAMAGLRLGFAVASGPARAAIMKVASPWSVNTIALKAGRIALGDAEYAAQSRAYVEAERQRMTSALTRLGLKCLESSANYLMLDLPGAKGIASWLLREHRIMIRLPFGFHGLHANAVRIAVRTRAENNRLLRLLATRLA